MKKFDHAQLSHFTGTEKYHRISRRHLLTDGAKYLAEEAQCFWMMDAIASHLSEIGTEDWFVQVSQQHFCQVNDYLEVYHCLPVFETRTYQEKTHLCLSSLRQACTQYFLHRFQT